MFFLSCRVVSLSRLIATYVNFLNTRQLCPAILLYLDKLLRTFAFGCAPCLTGGIERIADTIGVGLSHRSDAKRSDVSQCMQLAIEIASTSVEDKSRKEPNVTKGTL